MSLVNKLTLTEKKLAANRRNGSVSQGPTSEEGRERCAAANLRHGFYAKSQEVVLRVLGEDPEGYEELLAGLRQEFPPAGRLQEELLKRLARTLWLMDRNDRSHDGAALLRAKRADSGRENRQHARMMRLKMTAESLRSLARSLSCWHYVTTRDDLEVMKKLHQEGVTTEMGEIALALFYQLQEPGTDDEGVSEEEKKRRVVNSIRSIFGMGPIQSDVEMLTPAGDRMIVRAQGPEAVDGPPEGEEGEDSDTDDRYPDITEADWRVRERARKLLKNILTRQVEVCETQRQELLRESLEGPSPYERAAETAPAHDEALLVRRLQESSLREVRRLTNLLLKIQRRQLPMQTSELSKEPAEPCQGAAAGHEVIENKDT